MLKKKVTTPEDQGQLSRRSFLSFFSGVPALLKKSWASGSVGHIFKEFLSLPNNSFRMDPHNTPVSFPKGPTLAQGAVGFYRPPKLSLMTGFIKDPQHHNYSLLQWAKEVGKNFDAAKLVARAKAAGFIEIIWYDKWIDGLVFHKTQATNFRTTRDFLAELAPECRAAELRLIIYTNAFYDGNPEFAQWACKDQRGSPLVFSPMWPANLLSMYSPFREKFLRQVQELLVDYNVDGLWLDVPNYPTISYDPWTRSAFHAQYGKPMERASSEERSRFAVDSIVQWTRHVASDARTLKSSAVVTYNGSYEPVGSGPRLAIGMAETVDYFSAEMHTNAIQWRRVPVLSQFSKPAEAGYLVSEDWFSPLDSGPLKTMKSEDQMDRVAATVLGGGINLYGALALAHDGKVDEESMDLLGLTGSWLKARREYLQSTTEFCDVGIVLGSADSNDLIWPGGGPQYEREITALEVSLRKSGFLPCRLLNCAGEQRWEAIPSGVRTLVLPDRVCLKSSDREKVLRFVERGGTILAFGRGAGLARSSNSPQVDTTFGVTNYGYIEPAQSWGFGVEWKRKSMSLLPPIIFVRPEAAQTIIWAQAQVEGAFPLVTVCRVGKGKAWLIAVTEASLAKIPGFLGHLWETIIGEPVWKSEDPGRYTLRVRSQKARHVLHIADSLSCRGGSMGRYHPEYSRLELNNTIVSFHRATIVPSNRAVPVEVRGIWKSLELYPDPELTVLLD